MADQHQPTGQQAPGLSLQQLQAANFYANMPLESPLFLPIMPVSGHRIQTHSVDLDSTLTWLACCPLHERRWSHHPPLASSILSPRCFRATQRARLWQEDVKQGSQGLNFPARCVLWPCPFAWECEKAYRWPSTFQHWLSVQHQGSRDHHSSAAPTACSCSCCLHARDVPWTLVCHEANIWHSLVDPGSCFDGSTQLSVLCVSAPHKALN
jgi:hypothetical protein